MLHNVLEKLQLRDEKNLLIQGLPSSIEKQFAKLTFAKNITPLLRSRRIDFALLFAVNETQLNNIINEIMPALHEEGKLWVAYPKLASKIATTLNRDCSWKCITCAGYESVDEVTLDHVWTAIRFHKVKPKAIKRREEELVLEGAEETVGGKHAEEFGRELKRSKPALSSAKQPAKSF